MLSGYRSLITILILSINSFGQIFTEDFNQPAGSLLGAPWTFNENAIKPYINTGNLVYNGYVSDQSSNRLFLNLNGNLLRITRSINQSITENTLYCSFLINLNSIDNLTSHATSMNNSFFSFGDGSIYRGYLFIRKINETSFRIGLCNKDNITPTYLDLDLQIQTTHLFIAGYRFYNGSQFLDLWINPVLSEEQTIPDYTLPLSGMASVSTISFYQRINTGDLYIDAIRVATTWNDSALPVELEAFNAEVINNSVVLNWSTATEVNNYGFEVERSFDKSNWECVKFVPGNGNSNRVIHYTYTDNQAAGSTVYYRLKQVDTDGSFTYSEVAEVKLGEMKYALHQNYPNPFNPETTIKYSIAQRGFVNIKIYDITGKEVKQLVNESMDSGEYSVKFNGSALPSGVYMYRIRVNGFVECRKMLLLN